MKLFAICIFAVFAVTYGDSDVTFKVYNEEGGCHGNKVGEHLVDYDSDEAATVNLCAEKCSKHAQCNYFTFGHGYVDSDRKTGQCHLLKSCTKVTEQSRTAYIMGDYVEKQDDSDAYQYTEVVDSDGSEGGCGGDADRFINGEQAPYQGARVGAKDTQECANKCGASASQGCLYFSISEFRGGPGTSSDGSEYRCHLLNECHAHLASKKWKSYKMTVQMASASDATAWSPVGYDLKISLAVIGCVACIVLGTVLLVQKVRARKSAEATYAAVTV